jgi:arylsulfatase
VVDTLSLFQVTSRVGEDRIKSQPGKFSFAGDGLCVGRDSSDPVTAGYPGTVPWAFTGGAINRVAIDVSGEPYVDLERWRADHSRRAPSYGLRLLNRLIASV